MTEKKVFVKVTNYEDLTPEIRDLGILGEEILEFKKIKQDDIPKNLKRITDKIVGDLVNIYTLNGTKIVYDENSYSHNGLELKGKYQNEIIKEYVDSDAMYFDDKNHTIYFEFNEDSYGKFVYLFKKEGKLYRLTC